MAGFVPEPRIYRLVFEDPAYGGLVVRARSVSIGEFLAITGLDETTALGGVTLRDDVPVRPSILEKFAGALVEWNLGPDGAPWPATLETLREQDVSVARSMVKAWLEAVSGVAPPLRQASSDGPPSPEASLRLAESSESLAS